MKTTHGKHCVCNKNARLNYEVLRADNVMQQD